MTAKESMRARYETRHESITAYKFMRADQENISIFSNIKRIFMPYNKYVCVGAPACNVIDRSNIYGPAT